MGTIIHRTVTAVMFHSPYDERTKEIDSRVEEFRNSMEEEYRHLLIGPVESVANFYATYTMLPDASKEGWGRAEQMNDYRDRFAELMIELGCYQLTRTEFGDCPASISTWQYIETEDPKTGEVNCKRGWVTVSAPQPW